MRASARMRIYDLASVIAQTSSARLPIHPLTQVISSKSEIASVPVRLSPSPRSKPGTDNIPQKLHRALAAAPPPPSQRPPSLVPPPSLPDHQVLVLAPVSSPPPIAQAPPILRPRAPPWRLAAAMGPRAAGTGPQVRAQVVPRVPTVP